MDWNLSPTTFSPVAPGGQLADSRPHKIEIKIENLSKIILIVDGSS